MLGQIPGGPELAVFALVALIYLLIILAAVGGIGYLLLRFRSGGSVEERLDRIERKIGRLEAQVEHLRDEREE